MDNHESANTINDFSLRKVITVLRHDLPASVVVFLVALPLCMGIAIASGAPVASGLITGIVGGLVVGFLAGSPLQVSGPAAGLTVVVYGAIQEHGLPMLGVAVLIGGAIQFAAGLFRLGQWFRAVSPAVIRGMLSGIGVLIFASQFHVMVDDQPKDSGLRNLLTIPAAIEKGIPLPEWQTDAEREFRTVKLKEIGQLHEKQQEIQEDLAETIPKNPADSGISRTDFRFAIQRQKEVTQELDHFLDDLSSLRSTLNDPVQASQMRDAATAALEANQRALSALKQEKTEAIIESQNKAVTALEETLTSLKSHAWAAKVGLFTIIVMLLWQTVTPKKIRLIPAPLVAVVLTTAVAAVWALPVIYVEVPDNLLNGVNIPSWSVLQENFSRGLVTTGIVIAVVASAETLLCATAVDQMHQGPRTQYDRELWAQGVGNMICGVLGALPMTGVIVRSSSNVMAGATTRVSAILHGLWLLIFVAALGFLMRMIPTACLAAILVYIGYKLINFRNFKELWQYGKGEVVIYVATVTMIVVQDLLTGVLVGVALSAVKLLYTFSHLRIDLEFYADQRKAILWLEGAATFIRLPQLAAALERVPNDAELHVDFQHLDYIDHACLNLLANWAKQHQSMGGKLVLDWESLHARFKPENGNGRQQRQKEPTEAA